MATSIYDNKNNIPNDDNLDILKTSYPTWNHLIDFLEHKYGNLNTEWKFYSKNSGWCFKISNDKKNLLFLLPNDDYFIINVNMSTAISKKILKDNIKNSTKLLIEQAKQYVEGISILLEIRNNKDLDDIKTILNVRDK
jgi:hypothetical protein